MFLNVDTASHEVSSYFGIKVTEADMFDVFRYMPYNLRKEYPHVEYCWVRGYGKRDFYVFVNMQEANVFHKALLYGCFDVLRTVESFGGLIIMEVEYRGSKRYMKKHGIEV